MKPRTFMNGDRVTIVNTNSSCDGVLGEILGRSTEGLMDFYIVKFIFPSQVQGEQAMVAPECCVERIPFVDMAPAARPQTGIRGQGFDVVC